MCSVAGIRASVCVRARVCVYSLTFLWSKTLRFRHSRCPSNLSPLVDAVVFGPRKREFPISVQVLLVRAFLLSATLEFSRSSVFSWRLSDLSLILSLENA